MKRALRHHSFNSDCAVSGKGLLDAALTLEYLY
jgi:hypothetical protein